MARTSKQIEGDIYRLLRKSKLAEMVSGEVCRERMRPKDSALEDIVVIFTTGDASQIQSGVVTIHIYVPACDPYDDGTLTEDGERCEEIEACAQAWVEDISDEVTTYAFELAETIHTSWNPDISQSFVVIKLSYRLFEDD